MISNDKTRLNLQSPKELITLLPLTTRLHQFIENSRQVTTNIQNGTDGRLLVIVGPCSIHDISAALEYGAALKQIAEQLADELFIIMRVYFEKPRTTIGWKGLISDPHLDNSFDINHGLFSARQLLINLNNQGIPAASEFLDVIIPHYLSDLVTWSAIGARTVESPIHRELASSLPMPIGFKNNIDGNIKVAIDAVKVANHPHRFVSITEEGKPAILHTKGNSACHIILRGTQYGPNYTLTHIRKAAALLKNNELIPRLMVDCSHGNSMKDYRRQSTVLQSLIQQIEAGSTSLLGLMLESNLIPGKQEYRSKTELVYGQSITDGCIGWEDTVRLLTQLANTVKKRRLFLKKRLIKQIENSQ